MEVETSSSISRVTWYSIIPHRRFGIAIFPCRVGIVANISRNDCVKGQLGVKEKDSMVPTFAVDTEVVLRRSRLDLTSPLWFTIGGCVFRLQCEMKVSDNERKG